MGDKVIEMQENKPENNLRSEEVQEVMGTVPRWIVRWGITVIAIVLLLSFVGSYFFHYPDKLTAEVKIVSSFSPAYLSAQTTGFFSEVPVHNREYVTAGTILAVIDNPASMQDVELFTLLFQKWQTGSISTADFLDDILVRKRWNMGELQSSFTTFVKAMQDYCLFHRQQYYPKKMAFKKKQITEQEELRLLQEQDAVLKGKQVLASRRIFYRDSILRMKNMETEEDYDKALQAYLQSQQTGTETKTTRKQGEMQQLTNEESLLDLRKENEDRRHEQDKNIQEASAQLKTELDRWERTYLIKSPIDGFVNMTGEWTARKTVANGDPIFVILPRYISAPSGYGLVPAEGAGKVEKGQKVYVRVKDFPDTEFGFLEGIVKSISGVPDKDNNYFIEISFPDGLVTNYKKRLPISRQMSGTAEIVIKNKRLIENIIQPLEKLMSKMQ